MWRIGTSVATDIQTPTHIQSQDTPTQIHSQVPADFMSEHSQSSPRRMRLHTHTAHVRRNFVSRQCRCRPGGDCLHTHTAQVRRNFVSRHGPSPSRRSWSPHMQSCVPADRCAGESTPTGSAPPPRSDWGPHAQQLNLLISSRYAPRAPARLNLVPPDHVPGYEILLDMEAERQKPQLLSNSNPNPPLPIY